MDQPSYPFRATIFSKETTYLLGADALSWRDGGAEGRLAYTDIRKVRAYAANQARCVLWPRRGRAIVLCNQSFTGFGRFEDRSAAFYPFAAALIERVAKANQQVVLIKGMPGALFVFWLMFWPIMLAPVWAIAVVVMLAKDQSPSARLYWAAGILLAFLFSLVPNAKTMWPNRPRRVDPRAGASLL